MKRINFQTWGRVFCRGYGDEMPGNGYAVQQPYESASEAVARSIARRTGLVWCGGPRSDGIADGGAGDAHFVGTLGSPAHGGGWTPRMEVWFSI